MTNLVLTPALKPDPNKLDEAYEVVLDDRTQDGAITIRVPKFFQFDGASIPWAAQPLIGTPFEPRFMGASVFTTGYHTHQISRAAADELFYGLLLADGVGKTKAWLMREAVVVGGGGLWDNDEDDLAYIARLKAASSPTIAIQRITACKRLADPGHDRDGTRKACSNVTSPLRRHSACSGLLMARLRKCTSRARPMRRTRSASSIATSRWPPSFWYSRLGISRP